MNLPNKLTLSRIAAIPIFMVLAFPMPFFDNTTPIFRFLAVFVYVIASITDSLDGYIARKRNIVTNFGKFVDPIADKLLVTAALFALIPRNPNMYLWATMLIISREFIVTGMRLVAASNSIVIAAGKLGKLKMIAQTIAIIILLISPLFTGIFGKVLTIAGDSFLAIAVILTIISGIEYVVQNIALLKKDI